MKTSAAARLPPDLAAASKRSHTNISPLAIAGHRAIFTLLYRDLGRPGNSVKTPQRGPRWQCHAGCWVRAPTISHVCARDSRTLARTFPCRWCWNRNVGCTWLRHHTTTPRGSNNQLVGTVMPPGVTTGQYWRDKLHTCLWTFTRFWLSTAPSKPSRIHSGAWRTATATGGRNSIPICTGVRALPPALPLRTMAKFRTTLAPRLSSATRGDMLRVKCQGSDTKDAKTLATAGCKWTQIQTQLHSCKPIVDWSDTLLQVLNIFYFCKPHSQHRAS